MNKTSFKLLSGFKYVYLLVFFALLSGLFYPLINDTGFIGVFVGVLILSTGLAGGVLLYRTATSENKKGIFLGAGFALMAVSAYFIFYFSR